MLQNLEYSIYSWRMILSWLCTRKLAFSKFFTQNSSLLLPLPLTLRCLLESRWCAKRTETNEKERKKDTHGKNKTYTHTHHVVQRSRLELQCTKRQIYGVYYDVRAYRSFSVKIVRKSVVKFKKERCKREISVVKRDIMLSYYILRLVWIFFLFFFIEKMKNAQSAVIVERFQFINFLVVFSLHSIFKQYNLCGCGIANSVCHFDSIFNLKDEKNCAIEFFRGIFDRVILQIFWLNAIFNAKFFFRTFHIDFFL